VRYARTALAVLAFGVALLLAAPTLDFPFGGDHGLYHYVGREWLFHGALPYRDVFEQKTPGIFLVYGLAMGVFGEHMWAIRVLDVAAVLLAGTFAAIAATPASKRPSITTTAFATLAAAIFYFATFGFWDLAQCEIWVCVSILGALAAARRLQSDARAATVSGLACGVALVFKPPAIWLVLVCAATMRARAPGRRALAIFAAAAAVPWTLLVAYFAARGGIRDLFDVLVGANGYYVRHEHGTDNLFELLWRMFDGGRIANPLSTVLAYATLAALWKDRPRRVVHLQVVGLAVAVVLAVTMQMKFYRYHFGLVVAPGALAAAAVAEWLDAHGADRKWAPWTAPAVALGNLLVLLFLSARMELLWFGEAKQVVLHRMRRVSDEQFESYFRVDRLGYDYHDDAVVAAWLRAHASPGDRLVVRGFEPQIYALTGMSYGGRFFWTTFLTMPTRAYRRAEWLERDRADVLRLRPRWAVTRLAAKTGPDSTAYFEELGYVPRVDLPPFEVLERRR
jgi:hypothetical protein